MRRGWLGISPIALLLAVFNFGGCKVGPDYHRPASKFVEASWSQSADPHLNGQPVDPTVWWESFNDPMLNNLVEIALAENIDIKEAGKRILEVRALRDVAAGSLYPQQQTLNGFYQNVRISRNTANFVTVPGFFETDRVFDVFNNNFNLAWELDFWGRLRRTVESADAQVEQTMAAYDMVKVVMLAELAKTYIEMRTIESRMDLVRKHIEIQAKLVELSEKRMNEGTGTKLDYHQSSASLAKIEAILPGLDILRRHASNRICVLLGCAPTDVQSCFGEPGKIPTPPSEVASGIPCDLLRRRPDVQMAERELAAQSARIGIAEAEFYPHISLVGQVGVQAKDFSKLYRGSSITGNVGPGFSWNLLNYGRIKSNVRHEQEAFERLCYAYQNSVLKAYQEVEDAQTSFVNGFQRLDATSKFVHNAFSAAEISLTAYEEGAIDFDRVLELQSQVVQAEDALASVRGDLAMSLVKIYMAMGGGWSVSGCTEPVNRTFEAIVSSSDQQYQNVPAQPYQNVPTLQYQNVPALQYQNVPAQGVIDANDSIDNSVKPTTDGGVVRVQSFNHASNTPSAAYAPTPHASSIPAQQHASHLPSAPYYPMPGATGQNPPINPQAMYAPSSTQAQMAPYRPTINTPNPQPVSYVDARQAREQNSPMSPTQFHPIGPKSSEPNRYGPPRNAAVQWMQR